MTTEKRIFTLCDRVRETAFALHCYLRHGHLEKVYENGLAHRLREAGLRVEQQHGLQVLDEDGTVLGIISPTCWWKVNSSSSSRPARRWLTSMSPSFSDTCAVVAANTAC